MRTVVTVLIALLVLPAVVQADEATEREVREEIIKSNEYVKKNLKGRADDYSSQGAVEFWSSGGLMQKISSDGRPAEFESFNINVKHIHVTTLVPGQAAVAHYYSEGSMQPKGAPAVSHYLTRASQVFVKEDGQWKVRASHWSPVSGGSGTSQTALKE